MNRIAKLQIGLLLIGCAIFIPFYFEEILYYTVAQIGIGWVATTILIRTIVIVFFTIGLKLGLDAIKPKLLKNWILLLIGIPLGFVCSFAIVPIYDVDYFMQNDGLKFEHLNELSEVSDYSYTRENKYEVLAFLDVGCSHCKIAAERLGINHKAGQKTPIQLFFNGDEADVNHFRESNGIEALDYHTLPSEIAFIHFAGFEFPSIFLIAPNGEVEYHWVADDMNYSALDYLLTLEQ